MLSLKTESALMSERARHRRDLLRMLQGRTYSMVQRMWLSGRCPSEPRNVYRTVIQYTESAFVAGRTLQQFMSYWPNKDKLTKALLSS